MNTSGAYPQPIDEPIDITDPKLKVRQISREQADRESALTESVLTSFDRTESLRLRQLMPAVVRHLHAFIPETRLTAAEWSAAIPNS